MATTAATLIERTRRKLRDWPQGDVTTASISSSGTTLTVADATIYAPNWVIEVESEAMIVRAASGTSVTVARGARGSTAATHATASSVLIKPRFLAVEILDAINDGIDACWPLLYKEVVDDSTLVVETDTYEYAIPATLRRLSSVEIKRPGDGAWRPVRDWSIHRGSSPVLKFRSVPVAASELRLRGYAPFPRLAAGDSTDALFPDEAIGLPVDWAVLELLYSGEASRVRQDVGAIDNREQATRVGSSSTLANALVRRFYARLEQAALPPIPPHVVPVY